MTPNQTRSLAHIIAVLAEDLWNEHHYQITATADFYKVLTDNIAHSGDKVGDEASLASALIHTRALLEFYAPGLKRKHEDSVWWVTALGVPPKSNSVWERAIGKDWQWLQPWQQPINTFLGHLSWARRTLTLPQPPDENNQRWPLRELTRRTIVLLDRFVDYTTKHSTLGPEVLAAVKQVQQQTHALFKDRFPSV